MKMVEGILVGAIVAATALGIAWWLGWVSIAAPHGHEAAAEGAAMDLGGGRPAGQPVLDEEKGGMKLPAENATGEPASGIDMSGNAVMISAERQQLIGVRTATVARRNLEHRIRTVGKVEYDETRVAHIHTKVTGWIEKLHVDFTGKLVEPGQPLLEIYSPELVSTQEEYLLALRAQESLGQSQFEEIAQMTRSLLAATRRRLEFWDISDAQIVELETRREAVKTLALYSPIRGYVIHKNAYEGQFVDPKTDLFTIADLREVWVMADIYEQDLPYIHAGQRARITLSYLPGASLSGRVDYVYPYLEGATRTVKARIVLPNRDMTLKPGMYANVEIMVQLGESLVIPEDSVIDTGERQVVFVVTGAGHFEPVNVTIGGRFGGLLQVLAGLNEGDVVVSGAAFLVDSESKLRSAMGGMDMSQNGR